MAKNRTDFDERDEIEVEEDETYFEGEDNVEDVEEDAESANDLADDTPVVKGSTSNEDDSDIEATAESIDTVGDARIHDAGIKITMSQTDYDRLSARRNYLEDEIAANSIKLEEAASHGDLSENNAYEDAVEKSKRLKAEYDKVVDQIMRAEVINTDRCREIIMLDSKVNLTVKDTTGTYPDETLTVWISNGTVGIDNETGIVSIPTESEVYRKMAERKSGSFNLIGTDGLEYTYIFNLVTE